jgi:hypothetical protein
MDKMDGMDKNGLLNGRWTMDDGQRLCRALQADSNIADLTDPTDPSEKPIGQITNSRAIPSLKATTLQIFRFSVLSVDKN